MKVLVIIDMQPAFLRLSYVRKCIRPVRNLVHKFQVLQWPVLLLEMGGRGRTIDGIREYANGLVVKRGRSGSIGIVRKCKKEQWPLDFVLCGVYREVCVMDTAYGLSKKATVTVILNATRPHRVPGYVYPKCKKSWPESANVITTTQFYKDIRASLRS